MDPLLNFSVTGQDKLENLVQNLSGGLDTRAILDEGAAVLFNRIRSRFLAEQDASGTSWKSSQAALKRAKTGRGGGTLFDTGKLFRGLQLYAVGDSSRAIGENVTSDKGFPYPMMHNFGLGIFPRREFLGFGDEDVKMMSNIVVRRVVQALTKGLA